MSVQGANPVFFNTPPPPPSPHPHNGRHMCITPNKQRNLCVSILCKNKRDNLGNLNNKIVTDNRKFCKTLSSLFSVKVFHRECITFKEINKTITNNEELAKTFNTFFGKIVSNLNLDNNLGDHIINPTITHPVFYSTKFMKITQAFSK